MEDGDRRDVRAQHFMNQFQAKQQEQGVVGGHPPQGVPPVNPVNLANFQIVNEYNSFNLANITPPIAPRWKQPDNLLDEFRKFKRSCLHIFDSPMCHISSGKVKTSMLLIWAGPDGEDIYDNFNLQLHQANDVNYILQCFEEFCEPICNFRVAQFKFTKVDTFYNRILKLAHQCNFSDMNERLIDVIIFSTTCVKAHDKLLQMPNTLNLQQCLTVCRHYESLSLHIQQIHSGSDRQVEFLHKCHPRPRNMVKINHNWRVRIHKSHNLHNRKQLNPRRDVMAVVMTCTKIMLKIVHAWGSTCRKCNKPNHWEIVCGQVPKRPNKRRQSGERSMVSEVWNSNHRWYQNKFLILLTWQTLWTILVTATRGS